jgi:hypothetical protein
MSTLTTTVDTKEIASLATGFLAKSAEVRRVVADAIQKAPEIASAVIMAGHFAIEEAMTADDHAFILKGIAKKRILVEGGKQPSDEQIFSVIAEAESKNLDLGTNQYSIWSNGTLYIKENGFRKLFEMREDCSELDTDIKPPQWMKLQDRSCWHVPVKAWVTVKGRGKVVVDCVVGVNGNMTDGINKIEAHAERSVLRKLWKKVTSIRIDDEESDDTVAPGGVVVVEPTRIESQPEITELQRDRLAAESDLQRARDIVNADESHLHFVNRSIDGINESQSLEMLKAVAEVMAEDKKELKVSERVLAILRRLYQVRERELQGVTNAK